jgi:hypothetical protein
MFEIVLGRGKWTCLKQNGREQVKNITKSHIFSWNKHMPLIAVLHIEAVTRPYVMSKISYFIVRTFDVKHHAAHGTILINFGSEKRSYIFSFSRASRGLRPT